MALEKMPLEALAHEDDFFGGGGGSTTRNFSSKDYVASEFKKNDW
jgi:hypothetical protein